MAAPHGSSSSVPSPPPPRPKSPPKYPDLNGKRRETANVQMLEREIGFFEEELKSIEGLQPASKCCKDVTHFVVANSDPLIPVSRKNRKSSRFWKWLCGLPCFNLSWICCCCCCNSGFSLRLKMPRCGCRCCNCNLCKCRSCNPSCSLPKLRWCCACPRFNCCRQFREISCCCSLECCSLPDCVSCCRWVSFHPRCPKVCCSNCTKNSCNPCCLFL